MKFSTTGHFITALFLSLPPLISVITSLLSINIPSYLFIIFLSFFILVLQIISTHNLRNERFGFLFLSFLSYLLFAGIWTLINVEQNFEAPKEKFINLLYIVVTPILIIIFSFTMKNHIASVPTENINRIYFKIYFTVSIIFCILFIFFRELETIGRYILPGINNPIWISRPIGAGLLVYIGYFFLNEKKINYYHFSFFIFFFILLIESGTRAPFLSFLITFSILILKSKKTSFKSFIIFFVPILITISTYLYLSTSYTLSLSLWSLYYRLNELKFVIDSTITLFGNGFSMFGPIYLNVDEVYYPHNLILELYFEFGLVGILISAVIIYKIFKLNLNFLPSYLVIYFFINSLFSGDIIGNTAFFISLVAASQLQNKNIYKSKN